MSTVQEEAQQEQEEAQQEQEEVQQEQEEAQQEQEEAQQEQCGADACKRFSVEVHNPLLNIIPVYMSCKCYYGM